MMTETATSAIVVTQGTIAGGYHSSNVAPSPRLVSGAYEKLKNRSTRKRAKRTRQKVVSTVNGERFSSKKARPTTNAEISRTAMSTIQSMRYSKLNVVKPRTGAIMSGMRPPICVVRMSAVSQAKASVTAQPQRKRKRRVFNQAIGIFALRPAANRGHPSMCLRKSLMRLVPKLCKRSCSFSSLSEFFCFLSLMRVASSANCISALGMALRGPRKRDA